MNINRLILCTILLCSIFTSCIQEPLPTPKDEDNSLVPLEVMTAAPTLMQTKGAILDLSLPDGSVIGVRMLDNDSQPYDGNDYSNVPYKAVSSNGVQRWEAQEQNIYLSNTFGRAYAYYPYSEDVTSISAMRVEASSEVQKDYMYSKVAHSLRKSNPTANFTLTHALCIVRLSISRGTYTEEGRITSASVKGNILARTAILDVTTGKLTSKEGADVAIAPKIDPVSLGDEPVVIDILAIPSGNESKIEIELCIDGRPVKMTSEKIYLAQNNIGQIDITIDKGSSYVTSSDVSEWTHDTVSNRIELKDHTVTLGGDTENLTFDSSVDEQGNVTIIAAPVFTRDSEVKPVTIDGEATLIQNVDEDTGVMTITLSDIQSDVTVNFNSFWLWMTFIHDVTDITSPTKLYNRGGPERIKIDGVEVTTATDYQFYTTGEHEMRMALKSYKGGSSSSMMYNIKTLKRAILPEGMETLGSWGFINCSALVEVSLPSTLKSIGYQCFERSGLLSCVIPDGCVMSYGIFDECSSITYVKLPSDMKTIPEGTFAYCRKLENIDLPDAYTHINSHAFANSGIKEFHFPDCMSVIEASMFANCDSLKQVRLPANLKAIKSNAFGNCKALERIIQADGSYTDGVFVIPEGVTDLGKNGVCVRSPLIKAIQIPTTLVNVETQSFNNPVIERYVIDGYNPKFDIRNNSVIETATNTLLTGGTQSTNIHESVTSIGNYAFYESEIKYVDLPASITHIGDNAFAYSRPIQIISRALTPATMGSMAFQISQYRGTLKVPQEAYDAYLSEWMINELGYLGWSTARWTITTLTDGE